MKHIGSVLEDVRGDGGSHRHQGSQENSVGALDFLALAEKLTRLASRVSFEHSLEAREMVNIARVLEQYGRR